MPEKDIVIRTVRIEDAGQIRDIYRPYVEKTAITFEYEVPGLEEIKRRIGHTLEKYPYIAAEQKGELIGYAYTGPFIGRAAYGWSAETSIYVKESRKGQGIGRKLYQTIEDISRAQNILNLNACIGSPEEEDRYLTKDSIRFHERLGYRMVGEFHKCGYKFGTWYNMVWMEKMLGVHSREPGPVIPFPQLDTALPGITV